MARDEINTAFDRTVDDYLKEYWRYYPHEATSDGIHDYDDQMDLYTYDNMLDMVNRQKTLLDELTKFKGNNNLSTDRKLDLEVFSGHLRRQILNFELFKRFHRDPSLYVQIAVWSCLIFLLRDFAPKEERYRSMISRLKEIPNFLAAAKEMLNKADDIPEIWLKIASETAASAESFFSQIIIETSAEIDALRHDLMAAGTLASKAMKDYLSFIENDLSRKPDGNFAAGKEFFDKMLSEVYLLPYDSETLEKTGREYIDSTILQLEDLSRNIDKQKDWTEIIDDIKGENPKPDKVLATYRREVDRSRKFTLKKDYAGFPEGEKLEIIPTPMVFRPTYPYAGYMSPGPFETDQRGYFWVTPIDDRADSARQKEQLAGHSLAAIEVRTLHEGYPGHHLQLCHANRINSKVRRLFRSTVFIEGWALYCEEKFRELGYYRDKKTELIQLKDQLWRACRIVIDVGLHSGQMTFDDAVDMLVEVARLEKVNARAEVKRYSLSPTQPMSYLIGRIEIERFADRFFSRFPQKSMRQFHDEMLSYGSIPIALIEKAITGTI
jgi:uncharacterized protein (DUF885 family)